MITNDPNIAVVLLASGALGVCAECRWPGRIAPGVIGVSLMAMGVAAAVELGANAAGFWAIAAGMALLGAEAVVISRGPLTALGAMALAVGAKLLVRGGGVHWAVAAGAALPVAAACSFLFSVAVRARRNKRDILKVK